MTDKGLIYKARFDIADLFHHRNHREVFTTALHENETTAHFLMRLIGYCLISYQDGATISHHNSKSEPEVWIRDAVEHYQVWLDVDEPDFEKVLKAAKQADNVVIVTRRGSLWLEEHGARCERLANVHLIVLEEEFITRLAAHITRKLNWSVTIEEDKLAIADEDAYFESGNIHYH